MTDNLKPTSKQLLAIENMRNALGFKYSKGNMPSTLQGASKEISELKKIIHNNLSIGGTINPRHSPLFR